MPSLSEGIFSQSITYICEHGESGAMGIVINQPLELSLDEIFEHLEITAKKDFSEIKCKEYQRSSALKIREKEYKTGVETTKMKKDGETVKQINANKESFDYEIVHKMTRLGFAIDTYSEYSNKLTIYFD